MHDGLFNAHISGGRIYFSVFLISIWIWIWIFFFCELFFPNFSDSIWLRRVQWKRKKEKPQRQFLLLCLFQFSFNVYIVCVFANIAFFFQSLEYLMIMMMINFHWMKWKWNCTNERWTNWINFLWFCIEIIIIIIGVTS